MLQERLMQQDRGGSEASCTEETSLVSFQKCMEYAGEQGPYQHRMLLLFFVVAFVCGMFIEQQVFLLQQAEFNCEKVGLKQPCSKEICAGNYNLSQVVMQENTLTVKYALYCSQQWKRILLKSFPESLNLFGYLLFGLIGDMRGRIVSLRISSRFALVGIFLYSFAQRETVVIFGLIISSITFLPSLMSCFLLIAENIGDRLCKRALILVMLALSLGQIFNSVLSLFLNSIRWGAVLYPILVPWLAISVLLGLVVQSPKFVFHRNKIEAISLVNQIALLNHNDPLKIVVQKSSWFEHFSISKIAKQEGGYSFLLNESATVLQTLFGFYLVFVFKLNEYGAQISLDAYFSPFIRSVVLQSVEALAVFLLSFHVESISRKKVLMLAQLSVAILSVLFYIDRKVEPPYVYPYLGLLFASLIRLFNEVAFVLIVIWMTGYFPTKIRARAVGFCLVGGSLGTGLAYLLKLVALQAIFGVALAASIVGLILSKLNKLQDAGQFSEQTADNFVRDTFCILV